VPPLGQGPPEIVVEDPATGEELARLPEDGPEAVDAAARAARAAFEGPWGALSAADRGRTLLGLAALLRDRAEELAALESRDTGEPLSQARTDVATAARYLEYYGGAADKLLGETIPSEDGAFVYTLREPFGVVAHITPWNSPLSQLFRGVAPSLATGNTVLVKPSEVAPLSTRLVAGMLEDARLPKGVVAVVNGRGETTGAAVVDHPLVAHVTFTGSVATGAAVMAAAARRIVPVSLELGGKSPTIVLPDADLDAAVDAAAAAVIRNAGQSCFATTRILVHEDVHDAFAERLVARFGDLTVGPGRDDPDLGPLASRTQLDRALDMLESAVAEGATVACGGGRLEDPALAAGHFVAPTVLTGVANTMRVAREEVFGPVQCVLRFASEDEAVALANASEYGLAAGVFTRDLSAAHRLARRLEAGQGPDQPLPGRRGRGPVRRLQAQRHRPRAGPRGAAPLHADEDGHHARGRGAVSRRVFAIRYAHREAVRSEHFYDPSPPDRTTRRWRWTTTSGRSRATTRRRSSSTRASGPRPPAAVGARSSPTRSRRWRA
jgi:aldehyde dehydrogenase (NAD+)